MFNIALNSHNHKIIQKQLVMILPAHNLPVYYNHCYNLSFFEIK